MEIRKLAVFGILALAAIVLAHPPYPPVLVDVVLADSAGVAGVAGALVDSAGAA